jgi:hypothetical protein
LESVTARKVSAPLPASWVELEFISLCDVTYLLEGKNCGVSIIVDFRHLSIYCQHCKDRDHFSRETLKEYLHGEKDALPVEPVLYLLVHSDMNRTHQMTQRRHREELCTTEDSRGTVSEDRENSAEGAVVEHARVGLLDLLRNQL